MEVVVDDKKKELRDAEVNYRDSKQAFQKVKREYLQAEAPKLMEILRDIKRQGKETTMGLADTCVGSFCKIGFGIISYEIFWGMIFGITTSF
jgi:hypothetical protein